ncbi:hypothetical protein AAVH_19389 [Aphelenchoides avenae]|nr:hypothetical protein AAVH_19389 [Aphelenchus avenae]
MLVIKLHNIRAGEQAEHFANHLQEIGISRLERVPNPDFDFDPDVQFNDDSYATRPSEIFNRATHHLRQRLILIQRPCDAPSRTPTTPQPHTTCSYSKPSASRTFTELKHSDEDVAAPLPRWTFQQPRLHLRSQLQPLITSSFAPTSDCNRPA